MSASILCVCSGNALRSPILERFLLKKSLERNLNIRVESVGTHRFAKRKQRVSPLTKEMMRRRYRISMLDHRSRHIDTVDLSTFDLVVALTPAIAAEVREKGYTGILQIENVPYPTPATMREYARCTARLEQLAEKIVSAL